MKTMQHSEVTMRRDVPQSMRPHLAFAPDYVDVFTVPAARAQESSPEQWARAAWEGADPRGRFLAWRVALQLRMGSWSSPEFISGWTIADRGDDWIRIEARSWCLTANCLFQVSAQAMSVATMMRYDRAGARYIWTPLSAIHRAAVPGMLRHAARLVERARD
ncbi:MAG: hypothetical protein QOI15_1984 [Pseudonocardiales bacterium]|jgi:hypothetical protein|nr:hypothetical protein [Pseudonocardiales bacterium]